MLSLIRRWFCSMWFRTLRFEIYEDAAHEWRWRLKAQNGEILAMASEGYLTRQGAERSVLIMQASAGSASVKELN